MTPNNLWFLLTEYHLDEESSVKSWIGPTLDLILELAKLFKLRLSHWQESCVMCLLCIGKVDLKLEVASILRMLKSYPPLLSTYQLPLSSTNCSIQATTLSTWWWISNCQFADKQIKDGFQTRTHLLNLDFPVLLNNLAAGDYHHGSRADGIDGSNDDVGVWQQPVNIVVAVEYFGSRQKYLRFMSWGIRGPALISLYFYGESTESGWWWHGSSWNIEQGIEGSRLSLPLTHTVSECGTPTPGVGGAASWRLNMGVVQGVKMAF